MIDENAMQRLIDQAKISDMLYAYATGVDLRDWDLFGSLFADRLFLDFSSFHPSLYREVTREELIQISRSVEKFYATQHISSNHRHSFDGDRATCVSYMQAGHFLKRDGQDYACFLYGYYTYELFRSGDGWLIDKYALQVTAEQGEPKVFEWVGLR